MYSLRKHLFTRRPLVMREMSPCEIITSLSPLKHNGTPPCAHFSFSLFWGGVGDVITLLCFVVTAPKWWHPPRNHWQPPRGLRCRGKNTIHSPLSRLLIIRLHCDPVILEHLSVTRSCSRSVTPPHPCLCVFGSAQCECVCVHWCQRLSHSVSLLVMFP